MLTVNNKELKIFGIDKVISFMPSTTNYSNLGGYWTEGSLKPIRGIKSETYRILNTKFLFRGIDKNNILNNISKFIEECKDAVFKENDKYFEVEINGDTAIDIINHKAYTLEINFNLLDIYEVEKSITTNTNKTITINAPKPCYANLEISANTNVISAVISINDTDITIKNIKGNETIYIGSGKVLAGGKSKIEDVDIWEFPVLKPGSNTIKVNRQDVNVKVKYNERW